MWTKDRYKLTKLAIAILDVTVNYSDVVVTTVFSVRYNQTFNHCLRGFPSVVASVFPLVYFRFINPKYVFVRRLVGVLFGYVVTISHFEVLLEIGSVLYRIALWDFRDAIPFFHWLLRCWKCEGNWVHILPPKQFHSAIWHSLPLFLTLANVFWTWSLRGTWGNKKTKQNKEKQQQQQQQKACI